MKKHIPLLIILSAIVLLLIAIAVILFVKYRPATDVLSSADTYIENTTDDDNSIESDDNELEDNEDLENEAEESEPQEEISDNNTNTTNVNKYYLKVNYQANTVTVYTADENGNYTVPYKVMVCSTGSDTPTSGVYKISDKYTWRLLFGNVYGQYACRITGHILFHSVPYLEQSPDTLEYWEYDKLGTSASAGCIRLTVKDAQWIYNNCAKGTQVEFYGSSDPGPLGKPTAQKISNEDDSVRNWDPTDSNPNNPWKNYNASKETDKNTTEAPKNNTTTTDNNIVNNNTANNNVTNNNIDNSIDKNNIVDNNVSNNTAKNTVNQNNVIENSTNSKDKNVVTNDNIIKDNNTVNKNNI